MGTGDICAVITSKVIIIRNKKIGNNQIFFDFEASTKICFMDSNIL